MSGRRMPEGIRIRLGYEMVFECAASTPMLLMLYVHPDQRESLLASDEVRTEPAVAVEEFLDEFGNRCGRLVAPPGGLRLYCDTVVGSDGRPDPAAPGARQLPVAELPAETLPFLRASRYCETDLLMESAWNLFGNTPEGWGRVQAVCDWVHDHIRFGYEFARADMTAREALEGGRGVCRDITHLAVSFCRCLNIPARYASGYLGDIGIDPLPYPMDFNAWFEAYLEDRWHVFDPRHNRPRIGRVLMARGRDAADTALTTCFGPHTLISFRVWTEEAGAG
jgi:transglutaminase-like putative cysteine protease